MRNKKFLIFLSFLLFSCHDKHISDDFIEKHSNIVENKILEGFVLYYSKTCLSCQNLLLVIDYEYKIEPFEITLIEVYENKIERTKEPYNNLGKDFKEIKIYETPTIVYLIDGIVVFQESGFEKIRLIDFRNKLLM